MTPPRRREALLRARAALSAAPTLDLDARVDTRCRRARRRGRARRRSPSHRGRSHRVWRAVAGVAAAAAVIVGVVAVAGTNRAGESKSSSMSEAASGKATGTTQPAARVPRSLIEFGDVTRNDSLQSRVREKAAIANAPAVAPRAEQSPLATDAGDQQHCGRLRRRRLRDDSAPAAAGSSSASTDSCASARLGAAPVLAGTGTSGNRPVYVAVFASGNSRVAYVLSAADCSVVTRTTVP